MAFAPGMSVFPGGRVDEDHDGRPVVRGPVRTGSWAEPALARRIVVAGVRETFEEAGVLLAVDDSGQAAQPDDRWADDRTASVASGAFPEVLERRGLHIDSSLLVPIAHWITPEVEGRRFDTRFLAAGLPEGQEVDRHETETDHAAWVTPADGLAAYDAGQMPMLPPTVAVLADLASHATVAEALAWAGTRIIPPLLPQARMRDGQVEWVLVHGYTGEVLGPSFEPAGSEERGAL
jgi:8-oxo-dGTP pyrophosphatase MutT (NUDIX family)